MSNIFTAEAEFAFRSGIDSLHASLYTARDL